MSIFPTRVLFATDGSRDSELAATTAVGLANITGSELHVVHVGPAIPEHFEPTDVEPVRTEQEARRILDEQVEKIGNLGGKIERSHLRMGGAAEEVVELAEELGVGLVVLGSRGRGRIRRLVMGSVSDAVARHAYCPVLVVRVKPVVFPAKILLGTDGSEEATLAARTAADLVAKTGSELHVVHVAYLLPRSFPTEASHTARRLYAESYEEEKRRAGALLGEQVKKIEDAGASVAEAHLGVGRPDEEIIRLGEEIGAGLAIVGSRGLSPMKRTLMGSVSDSVVRHAHCPVLVVRREEKAT